MIDLRALREDPDRFKRGAARKHTAVDIDRVVELDRQLRALRQEQESLRSDQKRIAKESGPQMGKLSGMIKKAEGDEKARLEEELAELRNKPVALKDKIQALEDDAASLQPELAALLLTIPQPPDEDVPDGAGSDDNVELRTWNPGGYDASRSFSDQRGFAPKTHLEIVESLGLADFERGVKIAGSRSYALTGDGMRLHQALLRFAFDLITEEHGFTPVSVPVVVREQAMVGTGFFPAGEEQTYRVDEASRGAAHDLYLTGTGEVGLMGLHAD